MFGAEIYLSPNHIWLEGGGDILKAIFAGLLGHICSVWGLVRCILLLQGGDDGGDVNPDTNSTGGYAGQKAWLYYYY